VQRPLCPVADIRLFTNKFHFAGMLSIANFSIGLVAFLRVGARARF